MPARGRAWAPCLILFTLLVLFYSGLAWSWATAPRTYEPIIAAYGIAPVDLRAPYAHQPLPFFDLQGVLGWGECHARGIDILAINPCDPAGRQLNYSPLLLDLHLEKIGVANSLIVGVVMDGLFLLVLALVLWPRSGAQFAFALMAGVSYATAFALERGNLDLLIFILVAGACLLPLRLRRVALPIAALMGAGLKFYPITLMLTLLRERRAIFLAVTALTIALVAVYILHYWPVLVRIPPLLPQSDYFGDMFGARLLPFGLAELLGWRPGVAMALLCAGIVLLLAVCWRIAGQLGAIDWSTSSGALLAAGAILIFFCFLSQPNMDYRGIFLFLTLPGLWTLRRTHPRIAGLALALMVFCLWDETMRVALEQATVRWGFDPDDLASDTPLFGFFLLRQGVWWVQAAIMGAVTCAFVRQSPLLAGSRYKGAP